MPRGGQLGLDAWLTVGAAGELVHGDDPLAQRRVSAGPGAAAGGGGGAVGVVGGAGDLQQPARPAHGGALGGGLRLGERVDVPGVSFAKKAVARFRMATSCLSCGFSRRNAASSA